jgi:hypothetical protein
MEEKQRRRRASTKKREGERGTKRRLHTQRPTVEFHPMIELLIHEYSLTVAFCGGIQG